jgi:hypothetical protein
MFGLILVFFVSFMLEIVLFTLTSPVSASGGINHLATILFALNSGLLLGTLYCFILLGLYIAFKAYNELQRRSFIRRGALFGVLVISLLLFKLYGLLDVFIAVFSLIVFVAIDIIFSQKSLE